MKLLCKVFMISIMIITCFFIPKSYSFNVAQNICEYIAVDDKGRLRKLLKSKRLKLRAVFKDVSCDNNNILVFAAKSSATDIGELLIKKLPKAVIEKELNSLMALSTSLGEVAKARIGG